MAMPVASMLKHFLEFEHHMEEARAKRDLAGAVA